MDLRTRIDRAVALLREHQPALPYWGYFSGGKDSVAVKELARLAGVRVDWYFYRIGLLPPTVLRYIRDTHPDVNWLRPKRTFLRMMVEDGLIPMRRLRWCRYEFAQLDPPKQRVRVTGHHSDEPWRYAKKGDETTIHLCGAKMVKPVFHWTTAEIWTFIKNRNIPYCSLYDDKDEIIRATVCVGCSTEASEMIRAQFKRWPKHEKLWKDAFRKMWDNHHGTLRMGSGREWFGSRHFGSWQELWEWYLDGGFMDPADRVRVEKRAARRIATAAQKLRKPGKRLVTK